ncbi:MAG: HNH endonuclease, partial [Chloroflexi bacterium]
MEYGGVSLKNQELARALQNEICEGSAQVHATMAKVAKACAKFDEIGGWCDAGIRSFSHWLTINAGFNEHTGGELLRVGQALNSLPSIDAAFAAGQLSFDKVR